jgi:hypothetical protein
MAILKVSEFAEKYGIKPPNIHTYKNRKKLIVTDGYIDEENPINKIFVDGRKTSAKVKPKGKEYKTVIPEPATNESETEAQAEKTKRITRAIKDPLYLEFQNTNKLRDQKLEEEIRLARIRNDRIEGRLIPTEMVKKVLGEVVSRYKAMLIQQTEQLLRDTMNELQAGNMKITEACSKLTDIANESSRRSLQEIKANINNIINEGVIK